MLYLLYERLADNHHYIPVLNLLRYLTFRSGLALITAQLTVVAMGSRFIRWMQARQGRGQPIRTDGIERHVVEKAGTPTMGGLMFLAGIAVGTLLWADLTDVYVWMVLFVTLSFGLLGFFDDYAKVTRQTTAGISGWGRLLIEGSAAYHAGLASEIEAAKVDLVFCAGPMMKSLFEALPATRQGGYAETAAQLAPIVTRAIEPGDVVMVKGSRDSHAKALFDALRALADRAGEAA